MLYENLHYHLLIFLFRFRLWIDQQYALNFLKMVKIVEMPNDIQILELIGLKGKNYNILYLLNSLNLKKLGTLIIGGSQEELLIGENIVNYYLPILKSAFWKTRVMFSNWYFSSYSFKFVVELWSNAITIWFERCMFDFKSELNFETPSFKLKMIVLVSCYQSSICSHKIDFCLKINKAIAKCPVNLNSIDWLVIQYQAEDKFQNEKYKEFTSEDWSRIKLNRFKYFNTTEQYLNSCNYSR